MNDRYSKLAFLHRVKEKKTPSLSAQASFAPSSPKVAWSGKSLIDRERSSGQHSYHLAHTEKAVPLSDGCNDFVFHTTTVITTQASCGNQFCEIIYKNGAMFIHGPVSKVVKSRNGG